MKRSLLIVLIIAAALVVVGMAIACVGFFAIDFDFGALSTEEISSVTYVEEEDFANIKFEEMTCDIEFKVSEDEKTHIECEIPKKTSYSVAVEGDTLYIIEQDNRKWFDHIGINFKERSMIVFLPKTEYESLLVDGTVSDILLGGDISFSDVDIALDTGDVEIYGGAGKSLSITTDTGDVICEEYDTDKLTVDTDTGDVELCDVCSSIFIFSSDTGRLEVSDSSFGSVVTDNGTGKTSFADVQVEASARMTSNTGDIKLLRFDASTINIESDTGDVYGELLSEMIVYADSDTGDIYIPKGTSGGICEINTDTGDIEIKILK